MTIEITYRLNKENDNKYTYIENGFVTASVKNLSEHTIGIFEVFIRFKNTSGTKIFVQKCDVKINPNEILNLPNVDFTIGLWANNWSNFFNVGIKFREINGDRWSALKSHVRMPSDYLIISNAPTQNKKIFLSHSNSERDKTVVTKLSDFLVKIGFNPYIAERNPQLDQHLWEKIRKEITECENVIVLYSKDATKSGDIREEIGIVIGLGKKNRIMAVVEERLSLQGSILGQEYVTLDFKNTDNAIVTIANYLLGRKD